MRSKRTVSMLLVLMLLVSSFASIASVSAQDGERYLQVSIMGQSDIPTIDPSLAEDVSGIQAIEMLFPGLTSLNETTVTVEPGIATWEVSEDGATYTFSIMPEISWVRYNAESGEVEQVMDADGNPRYVTAEDVVFAIRRSLSPQTLSYYGQVLSKWIVGGEEAISIEVAEDGSYDEAALQAALDNLGVVAVDEYTVQITGPGNFAFLPNIYGMWMARPQPSWAIEEHGEFWTEPENIASYGPFALEAWEHDASVTFVANPFWAGTDYIPAPSVAGVVNYFLEGSAALANYEAGELDYINPVPISDIDRVRAEYADEFLVGAGTCTYYYGFNQDKAPFDNVHARRAFSLAIDRQAVTTGITRGGQIPAAFFTRPDQVAAPNQLDYDEVALLTAPAEERIAAAQAEWALYFEETGTTPEDLPAITLVYNESEAHAAIAEAIQQMWSDILGVEVQLTAQEFGVFLDLRENDAPQIFRAGWCYDYPDTNNWLYDVFRSDAGSASDGGNETSFVNEEFDAIVNAAAAEPDVEVRREMYGRAEVILNWEDVAIAPIYYYTTTLLKSPSVEGPFTNTGIERFEKWTVSE